MVLATQGSTQVYSPFGTYVVERHEGGGYLASDDPGAGSVTPQTQSDTRFVSNSTSKAA